MLRGTRDAERRAAQRSTACASGTCATHARVRRVHGTQHSVTPLHTPDARAQVPFLSRGLRRVLGCMSSSPLCGAASLLCVRAFVLPPSLVRLGPTSLDATSSEDVDIEVWLESAPGTVVSGHSHAEWLLFISTWLL